MKAMMPSVQIRRSLMTILAGALLLSSACTPQYVRDTDAPEIDQPAMSFNLDRVDIKRLYNESVGKLLGSSIARQWERQSAIGPAASVAIFPIRNESKYCDDVQMDTLLSNFETDLVNRSAADVVSHENQPELIAEIKRQQSSAYDPARLARYGRQVGAQYFLTGKLYDNVEVLGAEERVQYSLFIQVIEVETGIVKFQNTSDLTKGDIY